MTANARASSRHNRAPFHLEPLEDRELLSVTWDINNPVTTVSAQTGSVSVTIFQMSNTGPPSAFQLDLSLSGGTAVPGVDYTPGYQTVSFAPGQVSETVQMPILPGSPSEGTRYAEITLSDAPGGPAVANGYVQITHNADTKPPKVIATKMLTQGPDVTGFVITFSKDMAPGPLQDVSNYEIENPRSVRPGKGSHGGEVQAARAIPLQSAVYNPATHSVTLFTAGKVRKAPSFTILNSQFAAEMKLQSQSTETSPPVLYQVSPITDTTGNLFNGSGNGNADGVLSAYVVQNKARSKVAVILGQVMAPSLSNS